MSHPLTLQKPIYLDYASTTPLDPEVYSAMEPYLKNIFGNPSSIHQVGRAAFDAISSARQTISTTLEVEPEEIIFTGSGTESDNLAILGLAYGNLQYGNHIIVSTIEHKAVLTAVHKLEQAGFKVTYLPVDEKGLVNLDELKKALTDQTILVSIMYANNEIGTIQPIKETSDLIHKYYKNQHWPIIHTDACQAVGMLPISPSLLGVDAMTLNSSKIYGPKGIGLLYLKSGIKLSPQIIGGDQERGRRAGTENVALAIGFSVALKKAVENLESSSKRLSLLQKYFLEKLETKIPSLILNGHSTKRLPNNIHICLPDIEGESILLLLDAAGICAATGSACSSASLEPSHVLTAIGRSEDIIHGSIRFSFSIYTTEAELDYTTKTLAEVVTRLRSMTASSIKINPHTYVKNS